MTPLIGGVFSLCEVEASLKQAAGAVGLRRPDGLFSPDSRVHALAHFLSKRLL